jgi:DNA replication initiation complex subunit (GINS family)
MEKKYNDIKRIVSKELYEEMHSYVESLINEATKSGALETQDVSNDYTIEIGRVSNLCADYETEFMVFKNIKFTVPLSPNKSASGSDH